MTQLQLKNLVKVYPFARVSGLWGRKKALARLEEQKRKPYTTNEGVLAIQDLSLDIQEGEFLVLLGASGCGKSTLLRMIAGLEEVSAGEVVMDGQIINDLPPEDRDMAMIFQNYSLYPHFTVYDNIAFPLRNLHMPREQLDAAVRETARLLGLEPLLQRRPGELSGGQLQRVAIGRAIVRRPKLFLMDEPFSNLDAPMRQALRAQIKKLHRELGTTFLYVTHDQSEAFALGTRIVVMRDGRIEQAGTAQALYTRPVNRFVASFVGLPPMNFFEKIPLRYDGSRWSLALLGQTYPLPEDLCARLSPGDHGRSVTLGIRPTNVAVGADGQTATVEYAEPLGTEWLLHLLADGQRLTAVVPEGAGTAFPKGSAVGFRPDPRRFHLFDSKTGMRI